MNTERQAANYVSSTRKLAIATGVLYLITHVTSVGASILYQPILNDASYILALGVDTQVLVGVLLEVILACAVTGTAVALFPVVKRYNEGGALGYVGLRTLEAAVIAAGVLPLLTVVTLRRQVAGAAGADADSLVTLGNTLVELYRWSLLVGPGLICGVNTMLMAYLMYRSRLVPRFIPVLGLIGGPLVFAWNAAAMFGLNQQIAAWAVILVIPIFAWELSLAIRLIAKGFNPPPITAEPAQPVTTEQLSAA